jgi:hypothetical protein
MMARKIANAEKNDLQFDFFLQFYQQSRSSKLAKNNEVVADLK